MRITAAEFKAKCLEPLGRDHKPAEELFIWKCGMIASSSMRRQSIRNCSYGAIALILNLHPKEVLTVNGFQSE